jgi:hypothetical protein
MQRQSNDGEKHTLLEQANAALTAATGMPGVLEDATPEQAANAAVKLPSRRERAEALCTAALVQHSLGHTPDAGKAVCSEAAAAMALLSLILYLLSHILLPAHKSTQGNHHHTPTLQSSSHESPPESITGPYKQYHLSTAAHFIRGHTHASTEPVPLDFANIPKRAWYMKKLPLHSPILISRNVRWILYVAVTFIIFFRILLLRAIWHVRIGGLYELLEVQPLVPIGNSSI